MLKYEEIFPFWDKLKKEEKDLLIANCYQQTIKKDQILDLGKDSNIGLFYILQGNLRVSILSPEGRQVTLFHIVQNELCIINDTCIMKKDNIDGIIEARKKTELLIVPTAIVEHLTAQNIHVVNYMFEILSKRFSTVVLDFEELVFRKIDQRIAKYLLDLYNQDHHVEIIITQEELANEINSAREVVARVLRNFVHDGLVELKRGKITIVDIKGLENLL